MSYSSDCKKCKEEVEKYTKWISCQMCNDWFHAKCLGKKYDKHYTLMEEKNIWFLCDTCKDKIIKDLGIYENEESEHEKDLGIDENVESEHEKDGKKTEKEIEEIEQIHKNIEIEGNRPGRTETSANTYPGHQGKQQKNIPTDHSYVGTGEEVKNKHTNKGKKKGKNNQQRNKEEENHSTVTRAEDNEKENQHNESVEEIISDEEEVICDSRKQDTPKDRTNEEPCVNQLTNIWIGVGTDSWKKVLKGEKMKMENEGHLEKRIWLFGDSIIKGVGREIHFISKGYYKIMDRSTSGATLKEVRDTVLDHFEELQSSDLVIIEGGGNDLENTGEEKTLRIMNSIVKIIKNKVKENPMIMCIPMRRREEAHYYGKIRRQVNRKCLEKLQEWSCDGLWLHEKMNWSRIWSRDGVHLSETGKIWVARNIVEWAQHKENYPKI